MGLWGWASYHTIISCIALHLTPVSLWCITHFVQGKPCSLYLSRWKESACKSWVLCCKEASLFGHKPRLLMASRCIIVNPATGRETCGRNWLRSLGLHKNNSVKLQHCFFLCLSRKQLWTPYINVVTIKVTFPFHNYSIQKQWHHTVTYSGF